MYMHLLSTSKKCANCGGTEIDFDPYCEEEVCTKCGTVLEASPISTEFQHEDVAWGAKRTVRQFVSSDSPGGARGFSGTYEYSLGRKTRDNTLKNAWNAIRDLGHELQLNKYCIQVSFNFYKLALAHNLTRGCKYPHMIAACVYMTCRTERTAHLLIDCSEVLQINIYALGRTYLRLSQGLHINIPCIDPCFYVFRFANRLELGDKTRAVSMTALRLLKRMKKDCIHIGRRPTGFCGAALLMAARMHNFNRTIKDVIKIVRVQRQTISKRLLDFGGTPSSFLSLDEFMSVDLEEEQDPPSFRDARIKDEERLLKVIDNETTHKCLTDFQIQIEKMIDESTSNSQRKTMSASGLDPENCEANLFTEESVFNGIQECLGSCETVNEGGINTVGLGPNFESLNFVDPINNRLEGTGCLSDETKTLTEDELSQGIDDAEIDSYILSPEEANYKRNLWNKININYLKAQEEKKEKEVKEKKKKRPYAMKSRSLSGNTVGEVIENMLKARKISNKINYDCLKDLSEKDFVACGPEAGIADADPEALEEACKSSPPKRACMPGPSWREDTNAESKTVNASELPLPFNEPPASTGDETVLAEMEDNNDFYDDPDPDPEMSLHQIFNQQNDSLEECQGEYDSDYD